MKGENTKNLLYTFKIKSEEGEVYSSIVIETYEQALYVVAKLLEKGYFQIKAPAELISMEVLDYDC